MNDDIMNNCVYLRLGYSPTIIHMTWFLKNVVEDYKKSLTLILLQCHSVSFFFFLMVQEAGIQTINIQMEGKGSLPVSIMFTRCIQDMELMIGLQGHVAYTRNSFVLPEEFVKTKNYCGRH